MAPLAADDRFLVAAYPPQHWQPDDTLVDFLDAGLPPVYIGFGSMQPARAQRLGDIAIAALRRARVRGIVQSGWAGVQAHGDDVLTVSEVDHQWLFPRTAAVVHHAGTGTTVAGLRAGVPTVPVPIAHDQPFWSGRLQALGVAPEIVPLAELTVDRFAHAIIRAVHGPVHRSKTEQIAKELAAEDGPEHVLRALEILTGHKAPA
ncbi:glycosyltransferase [Streptomyces gardneri]|uniref:glycosyltransferase n=1 Tax=Streptomyces gardneri TaxID=66892 RepID=UPI001C3FDFB8|nr:nucleotide disphospho-sugar-binding domain-containing protein [Streptomyces gardneri]